MLEVTQIENEIESYFTPYKDGTLYLSIEGRSKYLVDKGIMRKKNNEYVLLVEERKAGKDIELYTPYVQVMSNIDQALKNIQRKKDGKMGTNILDTRSVLKTKIPQVSNYVDNNDIDPNEIDF
jgi:hypothetical protein